MIIYYYILVIEPTEGVPAHMFYAEPKTSLNRRGFTPLFTTFYYSSVYFTFAHPILQDPLHGFTTLILPQSEQPALRAAIERLTLNDSSVSVAIESSAALGQGWRLGFLGLLHMEVRHGGGRRPSRAR